jgi:hypothetical protein
MSESNPLNRRGFIGSSVAALAASSALAANTPAPQGPPQAVPPGKQGMPYGMLGKTKLSRMFLGGNLVTGCMHCRDLKYVNELFRHYVTEEKLWQTFRLAEENGINLVFESGLGYVRHYNEKMGGHLQVIPSVNPENSNLKDTIKALVDTGAVPAIYAWGVATDGLVKTGRIGLVAKAVELIKDQGLPAGVGGHSLHVPMECEKAKVPNDFYVKTFHRDDYPTATKPELRNEWMSGPGYFDNMWCSSPKETAEFMASVKKIWIAFKVLAAGAVEPKRGFPYAFRNGADFIAVGMFDFQIKENCETLKLAVQRNLKRARPWYA